MDLCACVNEECGDGEGVDSQVFSNTLRYINLAEVALGLVKLRGPKHLCACVGVWGRHSEEETNFSFLLFLIFLFCSWLN
jgi:hypothetical protein